MSGLAAIFNRDGRPADPDVIAAMLAAVSYRGPDGLTMRGRENIALGHAKLAVTPEDAGDQQPLVSSRTGCAIVADLRLDNREELLRRLPDAPSPASSDAKLVLRAYEAWGLDAIERILGDFAFVLWDPRDHRMICARDTAGQRTLYYRRDARTFAAGSEIHQLLQDPSVPVAPNENHIRDYLVPLHVFRNEKDGAETFYADIFAIPAGHMLIVTADGEQLRRYWTLRPREVRYRTDEGYAEHFRALFFDAVRARLRTAYPVGVLLSGGMDSSSITCTAQQLYRSGQAHDTGFVTFTSTFDRLDCDERPFIEDMQALYGFDARYISSGTFGGRLQAEPRGFRESPNMGVEEVRNSTLSAAHRAGVRTLLTGDVADSCVYGSRHTFDSLLRQGHLRELRRHLGAYRRVTREPLQRAVALYCLAPLLPLSLQKRVAIAFMRRDLARTGNRLVPTWMQEPLRVDLAERHLRYALDEERGRRFANETRESEYRLLYPPEAVRYPAPWSVEMWRPFADRRLHEFLLAIPPEQKFAPHPDTDEFYAGSKRVLRRAMRGILPDSIRTRTSKTVFSATWTEEIQRQWPEYERVFGPHGSAEIAHLGYVDQARFWTRLQTLRQGIDTWETIWVMRVIELETWLRTLNLPRPAAVTVPRRGALMLDWPQPATSPTDERELAEDRA